MDEFTLGFFIGGICGMLIMAWVHGLYTNRLVVLAKELQLEAELAESKKRKAVR